jgi:hypothetical protein
MDDKAAKSPAAGDAARARAKRVFWCVFDYGTGELVLRIAARSAADILSKVPGIEVLEGVPGWFEAEEMELARYPRLDLDAKPALLQDLAALVPAASGQRLYYVEYRWGGAQHRGRLWAANLAQIEARFPELVAVPMVLAPTEAWYAEIFELESLADRLSSDTHGGTGSA